MPQKIARHAERPGIRLWEIAYHAGEAMPVHAHEETQITLVLAGTIEERVGSRCACAGALSMGIKPAGTEHADRFSTDGVHTLVLRLDDAFLSDLDSWQAPLRQWHWLQGGAALPFLMRMLVASRNVGPFPREQLVDDVLDLIGAMAEDDRITRPREVPGWLAAVREEVCETYVQGVQTRALAHRAGVHPVYLARAFRRHYGESISETVRRRCIQMAAGLLTRTDLPIAQVAVEAGFADQSHLTRTLRADTASTPHVLRSLVASAP